MKADILVVVNPIPGGGLALRWEPLVTSYLAEYGRSIQFAHSRGSGDARELAAKGGDRVTVV
jgi:diacylglycerol kinase family enzyme